MADQWNDNMPAMGNQISADVPDIEENFGHIKSSFTRIFETWSEASGGNAAAKFDSATGFSDGTYNYEFPTNPTIAAHSVIMLGNSSTIAWFYLNTAPPGWKVLSTGADTVIAVAGGAQGYNVDGGNVDSVADWTTMPSHVHQWYNYRDGDDDQSYDSAGAATEWANAANTDRGILALSASGTKIATDLYTKVVAACTDGWRPKASVGKLFQLDTAV